MNITRLYLILLPLFVSRAMNGQYAPAAGIAGTEAVHCDSSAIQSWAKSCWIKRGFQQAGKPELGYASGGSNADCLGKADNVAVSLGDGGSAVVKFAESVKNISGFDFAVFENSFDGRFLELAFVDVSSDSIRWVRFPSSSLTQSATQTGTFDILDPEKIDNLAGKYQALYGTPFDLNDIRDSSGINLNDIRFIRITDVVGSVIDSLARYDSGRRRINDPWPTPFPPSGFDLDAVAILRSVKNHAELVRETGIQIYPLPAATLVFIRFPDTADRKLEIFNTSGIIVLEDFSAGSEYEFDVSGLAKGLYFIRIRTSKTETIRKLIIG